MMMVGNADVEDRNERKSGCTGMWIHGVNSRIGKSEIRIPKSEIELAERTGLEPASGFPR